MSPLARGKRLDDVSARTLRVHACSLGHMRSIGTIMPLRSGAPCDYDFRQVFKDMQQGSSFRECTSSDSKIARSRTKLVKIAWCLEEAFFCQQRDQLRRTSCMAIHQDGAGRHHAMMYTSVDDKLEVKTGVLGFERDIGTTSEGIANAMEGVVSRFCTKSDGAVPGVHAKPRCDTGLQSIIFEKKIIFDADGAENEQLAGLFASRGKFVNMCERVRDKTHASRWLTSKPWSADPRIWDIFNFCIMGYQSITRLIENSDDIKRIFNKHVQKCRCAIDGRRVRSMQLAKQRFDSTARPSARFVMWIEAVNATCIEVSAVRAGAPQVRANAFLEWITEARVVTMALIADASDDSLRVTRFLDSDLYDIVEAPTQLDG